MCNLQQLFECGQDDLPDALARLPVRETLRPLLVAKISRWKLDPMYMATDLSSAASAAKKKKSAAAPAACEMTEQEKQVGSSSLCVQTGCLWTDTVTPLLFFRPLAAAFTSSSNPRTPHAQAS
jgi:hypothetical protein